MNGCSTVLEHLELDIITFYLSADNINAMLKLLVYEMTSFFNSINNQCDTLFKWSAHYQYTPYIIVR